MGCRSCCQEPLQVTIERIVENVINKLIVDGSIQPGLKDCKGLRLPKDYAVAGCGQNNGGGNNGGGGGQPQTDIHVIDGSVENKILTLKLSNNTVVKVDLSPLDHALEAKNGIKAFTRDGIWLTITMQDGTTFKAALPTSTVANFVIHGSKWNQADKTTVLDSTLTDVNGTSRADRVPLASSLIDGIAYDDTSKTLTIRELRTRWEDDGTNKTFEHKTVIPSGTGNTTINGGITSFTGTGLQTTTPDNLSNTITVEDNKGSTFPVKVQFPITRLKEAAVANSQVTVKAATYYNGAEQAGSEHSVSFNLPSNTDGVKSFTSNGVDTDNLKAVTSTFTLTKQDDTALTAKAAIPVMQVEEFKLTDKRLSLVTDVYVNGAPVANGKQAFTVDLSTLTAGQSTYKVNALDVAATNVITANEATTTVTLTDSDNATLRANVSFPVTAMESLTVEGEKLHLSTAVYANGQKSAAGNKTLSVQLPRTPGHIFDVQTLLTAIPNAQGNPTEFYQIEFNSAQYVSAETKKTYGNSMLISTRVVSKDGQLWLETRGSLASVALTYTNGQPAAPETKSVTDVLLSRTAIPSIRMPVNGTTYLVPAFAV